jgi:ADP-heptose:LPS heptosyltransferase
LKSALLFRFGGLGDLLVTLPSLNLLRKAFPGIRLYLVGRKEYAGFLREYGVVDTAFSADDASWLPLFKDSPSAPPELEDRILRYDFAIGWFQKNVPSSFKENLSAAGKITSRFFVYDPASQNSVSQYFFERTEELVRGKRRPVSALEECCLFPPPESRTRTKHAVVHPGSGSAKKCWPLERFLETLSFLHQHGLTGTVVTGEAEERWGERLRDADFPPGWNWLRRPSLMTLGRLLQSATLYIGNDSGVTHLAAACGTNVIALFRKEFEMPWKPFGKTTVLSAEKVEDIPVKAVTEAVLNIFGSNYP